MLVLAGHDGAIERLRKPADLRFQHPAISEFEKTDSFRRCAREHRTERGEQPAYDKRCECRGARRRAIERTSKSVAESARRIEAMRVRDSLPFLAMLDVAECESETACPLVCVECDAMVTKEPSPDFERIEVGSSQVFILPATGRLLLDASQQVLEPQGRSSRGLHRPATLAWAIAR